MLSAVISSILSYPALQLALQPVHQWYVQPGPLVLGSTPLNSSTRIADRDRTVSRRSEPSSRTTLIGEQPNPWDLLQPQDVMSRHRGAKHCRRYELPKTPKPLTFGQIILYIVKKWISIVYSRLMQQLIVSIVILRFWLEMKKKGKVSAKNTKGDYVIIKKGRESILQLSRSKMDPRIWQGLNRLSQKFSHSLYLERVVDSIDKRS